MNLEQLFYWKVWVLSICYALLQFTQVCKENLYSLSPDDFSKGWTVLHRMRDDSDLEWNTLTSAFLKYWPLLAFQTLCSQILLRKFKTLLPVFYSIYSVICLTVMIGVHGSVVYLLFIGIMYGIHRFGQKSLCYLLTMCALPLLHNSIFLKTKDKFIRDETQSFLFDVGLAWLLAKCLSFTIDNITSDAHRKSHIQEIPMALSYCLYVPSMFTGPILSYEMFRREMYRQPSGQVFLMSFRRLVYVALWYFVYEFFLHFFYSSAIQFYPDIVTNFEGWALCGLGYALPMMFYLKYFVIYGLAGAIASLEGFNFPPPPKCISAVHLSSFLWRHFDRGLYLWIRKYLYYPIINGRWSSVRRLVALFVCFGFVCLWHGMDKAVTVWCILNFVLVSSEAVVQRFMIKRKASSIFHTRLSALIWTPHFIMMCLSCTFFLSNWDIGVLLMQRILSGELIPLVPLACIMYCGCHVSMHSKRWQMDSYVF